ncbi:hypothetical protein, partial [Mesoplasma seiffertii]|uniref:hypothetical protein n=1 Tax=Mesoplasma seiffertii TaxID=28224 RepID=UPI00055B9CC3
MEKKRKKTIVFCTVFAVTLFVVLVSVASCQIVNKGKEKPDPYIPKKLEDVIKTRNLGILESANETTVKSKLVEKNPELKEEYIKVEVTMAKAIETTNYIVKVSSTNPDIYIGEVTDVKFATETVVADHLDVTPILDKIAKLENQNFKDESALKNEIDGLIKNELITAKVTEIAKSRAISKHSYQVDLSSTSEMLILDNNESLTISVTFGQADNLSDVITNRDLGKLENSNQETVVNKLVEKNPSLKKDYIKVQITKARAIETT